MKIFLLHQQRDKITDIGIVVREWKQSLSFQFYFWKLSIGVISEIEVLPIWKDKNGQEL